MNGRVASRSVRLVRPAADGAKTVLVVDDNAAICDFIATHLGSMGYQVLTSTDPMEAQRFARSERSAEIDLLLTDVEMPQMRGDQLADWFAKERPQVRVLLMSASRENRAGALGVGFIGKPFSLAALGTAVRDIIES